jgi:hypothetical protein
MNNSKVTPNLPQAVYKIIPIKLVGINTLSDDHFSRQSKISSANAFLLKKLL